MSTLQQLLVVGAAVSTVLAAPAVPNAERACEPLPHGRGLIPRPDTAEAFQSFPAFSLAATSATTPVGYIQAYSNLVTTFNEPSQFIRYTDLDSYDVSKCAAECGKDDKCNIFGIFFERTPMYKPGPKCPNPSSSTMIKCTLWSGTISPNANINKGQIREQFRIVMAGSNAYVKDITFSNRKDGSSNILKNWIVEKYKNGAAIQVPLDCNGVDTYMGVAAWRDGKFDAQRCLDACKVAGDTDIQSRKCRFVNTYVQRRNGVQVAQHCAMFSEYWPAPFATNLGQLRGDVEISETDSYGYV
ncbi:hypothetical protein COCC4DRAFT_143088 [Bipolaris maydis ATCC 48331]|uniref:Apple domain-containing protein n=2 Tax=Cochliobolus heterostrophus TaxID=5016 RepID=M2UIB4_COCH5|nr:uncharacterized protein COCC4DRAFT_143088 [Bipolaris maydis ATCC 48331]EMD87748.1 hypothetical protein COCHEDRAFT_73384 [Bipolaris maydis C5]KAJ5057437.1 hypothetical protein J3E74DRAFT_221834 [Bipolaris maydis]ENI03261.1 hypothetical protein COCC4DRAFT_143088 [Bipolaris maydis ATCC 48331]KAJ6206742.1 hypothetical protein PSV09DRAFT_73384 [Bipolaris maydis]KAJ6268727.1 hypothetical protein PSV08DRAFT_185147 [Bipolaris maydis]